jgi:hypothetical protein
MLANLRPVDGETFVDLSTFDVCPALWSSIDMLLHK